MSWIVELLQRHHLFDFAQILRDHPKQSEFLHAFLKIKQLAYHFFLQASFHSRRHHVLKLIVVERVGHCLLATNANPSSRRKEKASKTENVLVGFWCAFNLNTLLFYILRLKITSY